VRWSALALIITLGAAPLGADVKVRDKGSFKLEGFLGRMVGMFGGGKASGDGFTTTRAIKGDRKIEMTGESSASIVDLKEEKVYELDMKRKTYEVVTFDEIRRRLKEAQERAQREAPKEEREEAQEAGKPEREVEFDFDVKETGQTKSIAGHNAREVVMTLTMREKGKTLEESGGFVLTSTSWMGPVLAPMQEFIDFEMRYWKAIAPEAAGMSAEGVATLLAMYPALGKGMERLRAESSKFEGTPLANTTTFETVKSKEQLAQSQGSSGGGGLGGMLARRMRKTEAKPRSLVFTSTQETLEVSTDVQASELEIPAGFKEKK
jgi:hypothetical protein